MSDRADDAFHVSYLRWRARGRALGLDVHPAIVAAISAKTVSPSCSKYPGAPFSGNALRSFCAVWVAVGGSVAAVDDASTVVRDDGQYDEQPERRTLFSSVAPLSRRRLVSEGTPVEKQWPTGIGDVLILRTRQSYTVYAVGSVLTAGQHDFSHSEQVRHVTTHAEAVDAAKAIVAPGARIYLLDIDTEEWSQISN